MNLLSKLYHSIFDRDYSPVGHRRSHLGPDSKGRTQHPFGYTDVSKPKGKNSFGKRVRRANFFG